MNTKQEMLLNHLQEIEIDVKRLQGYVQNDLERLVADGYATTTMIKDNTEMMKEEVEAIISKLQKVYTTKIDEAIDMDKLKQIEKMRSME